MTPEEVRGAWFAVAHQWLPLRVGRDRSYVSPEAFNVLLRVLDSLFTYNVVRADPRLHGLEMRVERDCKP